MSSKQSASQKDIRKLCEIIASGSTRNEDFSNFCNRMPSHDFRITAAQMVREYRDKQEQGARLQNRWAQACYKNPKPISHQEKAENLQGAIDRVLRGGFNDGSRLATPPVPESVPQVEHSVMRGPEARQGGNGLGRGAAAQDVGVGREGRGERSLGTQRRIAEGLEVRRLCP